MRYHPRYALALCALAIVLIGCEQNSNEPQVEAPQQRADRSKSVASVRAQRRAFDGAPPVIAHKNFNIRCTQCHTSQGMELPEIGFAPPAPHAGAQLPGQFSRCRQCHVFQETQEMFVANSFDPLRQDMRSGNRLNAFAPPVIPHMVFMRENCFACHTGPAARAEIICDHPKRRNCQQCHVEQTTQDVSPF